MVLHIKNMVCERCIMTIRPQLENLGYKVKRIVLGQAEIAPDPDIAQLLKITGALKALGFDLLDKEADKTVEAVRNVVIELVHHTDLSDRRVSFPELLTARLEKDYNQLSRLFSNVQGITIEKFIIQQKVEKIKELLEYGELNLNEMAFRMGYSSSAHLSAQFKSVTGLSPSRFKASDTDGRKPIDKI